MSSYVYMKVLESTPLRYDRGIRMLSRGAIEAVYARIAELGAAAGGRVLDVGCGTGNVSLACAARGASVVGIDRDAGMLEVARGKWEASSGASAGDLDLLELSAMEIEDRFEPHSFDAAVSCLVFSELSAEEQDYVLATVRSRLRPGGVLVIADEIAPAGRAARAWWRIRRAPLAAMTWMVTQTTTHAVSGLVERVANAGFDEVEMERLPGDFALVRAIAREAVM